MKFPDQVPTLTDGDVTLRAHRIDDAAAVLEQCLDPLSVQWTTVPLNYTSDMAVSFVTQAARGGWESGQERLFAIESTYPDGRRRFSGSISLRDQGDRRAQIAFGAHPAVRGRGVMTTAANLLLDYAFGECDLETVLWLANVGNFASRRVAWKTGFTFGGVLRHWLVQRGEYRDGWVGTLHRDDPRRPTTDWLLVPTVEGERVALRPLAERDVPRIVEASRDERSQYWLPFLPRPYEDADARDFIVRSMTRATLGEALTWAYASRETHTLLGTLGLVRNGPDSWEIGYCTHPDARGKGATISAVGLAVDHLFRAVDAGGLDTHRIQVRSARGNLASRHVATANGFVQTGVERESVRLPDGAIDDMVVYDLLQSERLDRGR